MVGEVDAAARSLWPQARVVLFGSQATGLALPGADLDIVVLGVGPTLSRAGTGFTAAQVRGAACLAARCCLLSAACERWRGRGTPPPGREAQ